jgi:UPF0755 protein
MNRFLSLGTLVFLFTLSMAGCANDATNNKEPVLFEIKQGQSFHAVVKELSAQHIVTSPTRFKVLSKLMFKDSHFKFGVYLIDKNDPYTDLIDKFSSGKTYSIRITIPEGYTMFQIAEVLSNKALCTKEEFLRECRNPEFLSSVGLAANGTLEGYLYPDTYLVPLNYKARDIVRIFLDHFHSIITDDYIDQAKKRGMTVNQMLTMASIVEREAKVEFEKPIISGVYYNRLRKGMMLQADPTLIYALILENKYDGDIKFSDFNNPSPYNTYIHYGLPPTPIANPGKTAILAAIYPAKVDYLYFVAKPDTSGQHNFSTTLEEHNRFVEAYVKFDRARNPRSH